MNSWRVVRITCKRCAEKDKGLNKEAVQANTELTVSFCYCAAASFTLMFSAWLDLLLSTNIIFAFANRVQIRSLLSLLPQYGDLPEDINLRYACACVCIYIYTQESSIYPHKSPTYLII